MTKEMAVKILGIQLNTVLSSDLLYKYYRKRALEVHPDKYKSEPEKLRATRNFIKLKEAYEYLKNDIENRVTYEEQVNINTTKPIREEVTEPILMGKDEGILSYWILILVPGIIVTLLIGLFSYFSYEEFVKYKRSQQLVMFFIIVILLQFTPILIAIYFGFTNLINLVFYQNNIYATIFFIQLLLSIFYYAYSFLLRKYLENKYDLKNSLVSQSLK